MSRVADTYYVPPVKDDSKQPKEETNVTCGRCGKQLKWFDHYRCDCKKKARKV